jgi:hypothetical protein
MENTPHQANNEIRRIERVPNEGPSNTGPYEYIIIPHEPYSSWIARETRIRGKKWARYAPDEATYNALFRRRVIAA